MARFSTKNLPENHRKKAVALQIRRTDKLYGAANLSLGESSFFRIDYVALLSPGISLGQRYRNGAQGFDVSVSFWSVALLNYVRGNVSWLRYFGDRDPVYLGVGLSGGPIAAILFDIDYGGCIGPEFRFGKQFRTPRGHKLFVQAEIGCYAAVLDGSWAFIPAPFLSIGTYF